MKYDVVDQAIADGKLWKAKQALQGRLASPVFDRELLRRYGEVLLAMGDLVEAGRMLFCSGARQQEFREAIELFLSQNGRKQPTQFLSALPSMVRRQQHLAEFIASSEFERDGWTSDALQSIRPIQADKKAPSSRLEWIKTRARKILVAFIVIFFLLSFALGFVTILQTLWSAIVS